MSLVSHSKIFFFISILLILASLGVLIFWGLRLGIDFTGGSLLEVEFKNERPSNDVINKKIKEVNDIGNVVIQGTGEKGVILRFKHIDEKTHKEILDKLNTLGGGVVQKRFETIGPVIGRELKTKALYSIILSLFAIILYIAFAFRKVSRPVPSWKYGTVAIVALFHDILITCGIFSIFCHFYKIEVGLPFVAALLTILGYSVNNTIVIFDRLRENLSKYRWDNFGNLTDKSIKESITRCINTALTTLFVLFAIFLLGGASIKYFVLALIIGIIVGTYSSIFITAPLVVIWQR
ncbi:MAG: protein translocase subunit SecF [Candidatus Aminicenantes bacterium]|nr:protein translocase subunit SecF [Candidatus Aminicenantes bacterium]